MAGVGRPKAWSKGEGFWGATGPKAVASRIEAAAAAAPLPSRVMAGSGLTWVREVPVTWPPQPSRPQRSEARACSSIQERAVSTVVVPPAAGRASCATATGPRGSSRCVAASTTPKAPPTPAPRSARNRSACWQALAVRRAPSGVTTSNSTTRSAPSPYAGDSTLCPPPRTQPPDRAMVGDW